MSIVENVNLKGNYFINEPLLKSGLISILNDMLNNLNMMVIILKIPSNEETINYENDTNNLDNYNCYDTDYDTLLNRLKMKTNINHLERILTNCLNSINDYNSYETLIKDIEKIHNVEVNEKELFKENEMFKVNVKELKDMIINERRVGLENIQKATDTIGSLKDEIEDIILDNTYKLNYVKKWEDARYEQYEYKVELQMKEYENQIETFSNKTQNEEEIFATIENFYALKMIEVKNCIENWHKKYEEDAKNADAENNALKLKLQQQRNVLKEKTDLYNERKEKIEAYLKYKEKKRLEEEYLEMLNNSATKIQAWWRGVMVRHGFGPYRKRKGKSKKDNAKNNKKKSK